MEQETLDSHLAKSPIKSFVIENDELRRLNLIIGIIATLITCLLCFASVYFLVAIIPVFSVNFKTSGSELDLKSMRYRKYTGWFNFRKGIWKEMPKDANLVLLTKHGVKSTLGTKGTASLETDWDYHELYLMNSTHLSRFFLHSTDNKKEMSKLIESITGNSSLKLTAYSPQKLSRR